MNRRQFILTAGAYASLLACLAEAQVTNAPRRIGMHMSGTPATYDHLVEEFRSAMKSLGHVEGRDIVLDIRWAENRLERLPELAAELLALKPAVIITHGSPGVVACMQATSTVPIVFASAGDPVGQKFVQSFRRPGGNVTGVAFNDEINKKLYEVVREVLPAASRIATLVNIKNPAQKHHLDDVPRMSKALRFQSILVNATQESELEAAFKDAAKAKAHALVIPALAPFVGLRARIVELQNKYRVPTFHGISGAVQAGAVASYTFPLEESYSRTAAIVDKILKGGNPAEIPVELPTKYEIALNLQAAKVLGIVVPPAFLIRANTVIK